MGKHKRKNEDRDPADVLILRGIWQLLVGMWRGTWAMIANVLRGAWWLVDLALGFVWLVVKLAWQATVWLFRTAYLTVRYIFNGRVPQFDNRWQEEVFWSIKRRYRRRRIYMFHGVIFGVSLVAGLVAMASRWLYLNNQSWTQSWAWSEFHSNLVTVAGFFGVWLVILVSHYYLVQMGNAEDADLTETFTDPAFTGSSQALRRDPIDDYFDKPKHEPYIGDEDEYYEGEYRGLDTLRG